MMKILASEAGDAELPTPPVLVKNLETERRLSTSQRKISDIIYQAYKDELFLDKEIKKLFKSHDIIKAPARTPPTFSEKDPYKSFRETWWEAINKLNGDEYSENRKRCMENFN